MRNQISVALDVAMIAQIDLEANRCAMPRSHFIEGIIRRYMGKTYIDEELASLSRRFAHLALERHMTENA